LKSRRIGLALVAAGVLAVGTGCADMKDQPRFEPYEQTDFFPDGRASRELVDGTVPRGFLREDDSYYRGLADDGTFVDRMPVTVDAAMLERGRERYDIFCSPCHSMTGDGNGMIVQRGYKQASSYHQPRLRAIEDGYLYDVITNGFGQMAGYASMIDPDDRWAIVAYIRALQLAQFTDVATVEPDIRSVLERGEVYDVRSLEQKDEGDDHGAAH
jgi:mono/diheme cytochrome c family protein